MTPAAQSTLSVRQLNKRYVRQSWFSSQVSTEAVCDVDLEIATGRTLAIVGESGSGKSTLARCIAGLERPDSGEVWFRQVEITQLTERELRPFRSQIQLILQHSAGALNPRFTAAQVIEEPLLVQGRCSAKERQMRVAKAMDEVGLSCHWSARRVLQFSGGQRQRLSIARAIVLEPGLLILDEALTGLDLPIKGQILELLLALQQEHKLTYLFISHDLELVTQIADVVAVMYRGRVVELAPAKQLMRSPAHEYSKALVRAQMLLNGAASA